jgi:hypothetical protein
MEFRERVFCPPLLSQARRPKGIFKYFMADLYRSLTDEQQKELLQQAKNAEAAAIICMCTLTT